MQTSQQTKTFGIVLFLSREQIHYTRHLQGCRRSKELLGLLAINNQREDFTYLKVLADCSNVRRLFYL